jgi:hypothetical protein
MSIIGVAKQLFVPDFMAQALPISGRIARLSGTQFYRLRSIVKAYPAIRVERVDGSRVSTAQIQVDSRLGRNAALEMPELRTLALRLSQQTIGISCRQTLVR